MQAKDIFNKALDNGIVLYLDGDTLKYRTRKGGMPEELMTLLKLHKAEVLAYLKEIDAREELGTRHALQPIERASESGPKPLSHAQHRLWLLFQMDGGSAQYTMPGVLSLRGSLDVSALERAFYAIVERHETLRTRFATDQEGHPVQVVQPSDNFALRRDDVSMLPASQIELLCRQRSRSEAACVFDLERDYMLKATLLKTGEETYELYVTMHHIASDGWSMGILINELCILYRALSEGKPNPLPPLQIQYSDYSVWQRQWTQGDSQEEHLKFWCEYLNALPNVHRLPLDRARPARQSFAGRSLRTRIDSTLTQRLQALCTANGASLFMGLHAVFSMLLSYCSGDADIVIGSPIANRDQPEVAGLIGFFVNTLVLRADLSKDPSFDELLQQCKKSLINAHAHQHASFEKIVDAIGPVRSLSYSPLFQIMFVLQNNRPVDIELPGLQVKLPDQEDGVAKYDLTLMVTEDTHGMSAVWEYNVDLFEEVTIARFAKHFERLLSLIIDDPQCRMSALDPLDAAERAQLLVWGAGAHTSPARDLCVHELFEKQSELTPDAIAVVCGSERLTYRELNLRANALAHTLRNDVGVKPDMLIGLCMERSVRLAVGVLGILKSGAAYLPLDPDYPAERLNFMLNDAQAQCVLISNYATGKIPPTGVKMLNIDEPEMINKLASADENNIARDGLELGPENLAYVIYTSGSTGQPKGVAVEHASLLLSTSARLTFYKSLPESYLLTSPVSFDSSVAGIFWSWCSGAKLVIPSSEQLNDIDALWELILREQVDHFLTVPSFYAECLELAPSSLHDICPLRRVILAGETLKPGTVVQHFAKLPETCKLYNEYGPTEATVWSTCYEVTNTSHGGSIPIGKSPGHCKLYVVNGERLAPIGTPGELLIGGNALARGYLNQAQLTAKSFLDNPVSQVAERAVDRRVYRTGDLVRWLPDGNLEYLGRIDNQVKLRGFRIELGEIENVISQFEDVLNVVVVVQTLQSGDQQLVAYFVRQFVQHDTSDLGVTILPAEQEFLDRLRKHAGNCLPDFMIPTYFVELNRLPVSPNGKINKVALPISYVAQARIAYEPPSGQIECALAEIWQEILSVDKVGRNDNFFELGGHSLSATRMVAKVRQRFGASVPIKSVFSTRNLREFAETVVTQEAAHVESRILRATSRDNLPASFAQQRLWLLDRLIGGSSQYNMPTALRLHGELDISIVEAAFALILERHEALRTTFVQNADGQPMQSINAVSDALLRFKVAQVDVNGLPSGEQRIRVTEIFTEEVARGFDLAADLMIRATLIKVRDDEHVLLVVLHHIACDGWSISILVEEFCAHYRALARSSMQWLAPLPVQYSDYAIWQRSILSGPAFDKQLDYWQSQLAELPVVHSLPLDRPRPQIQTYRGDTCVVTLDRATASGFLACCQAAGATLFMGLHVALSVLVSRYSNERDIVIGTPIANREQEEIASLIGLFMNVLVLRCDLTGNPTFHELLTQSRQTLLDAYAHQQVPFEYVVERLQPQRHLSHGPLFQILLTLHNHQLADFALPGLDVGIIEEATGTAKYDLTLNVVESESQLTIGWEYNTDLFDQRTIEQMARNLNTLIVSFGANPEASVFDVPMMADNGCDEAFSRRISPKTSFPADRCIHELIEAQVAMTPDAPAITFENETLTYSELNSRANLVARYLIKNRDVRPDEIVGICMKRSLDLIVAALAILKAGAAYLPFDPAFPASRLRYMADDANISTVLTHTNVETGEIFNATQRVMLDTLSLHNFADQTETANVSVFERGLHARNLAYVIYTSGSTGNPKGVMIEHKSVVNFLTTMMDRPGLNSDDCLLAVTSPSFDIHVLEFFLPLVTGGRLVMAPDGAALNPDGLLRLMREHRVSAMQATPSTWKMLIDANWKNGNTLKALCGGEALGADLARAILDRDGVELWNMYGPTETTVWSCVSRVDPDEAAIALGTPIANTDLYIFSGNMQPVPSGVIGELYIGGEGLARGYLNRPEQTAEKFVVHSTDSSAISKIGNRLYRTGDLVRRLADGSLHYCGRMDDQVKIRGFRIELGEIEACLREHAEVKDAVVVADTMPSGEKQLVAYVVAQEEVQSDHADTDRLAFSLFYFGADTYRNSHKYDLYLRSAKFADENGFDAIWTPERHFDKVGSLYPNPSVLSAALATITSRVKLRSGSVVLPLHDPIRIAEEWSVVDNLSNGRVGVSIASGWHPRDFSLRPATYASRKEIMWSGIEEVKRLWRGEKIVRTGGDGQTHELELFPKPIQPALQIWVTAAGNPETFAEAGRMGANLLTHLLGQSVDELAGKIRVYREAFVANGHDLRNARVTLMVHTYLHDDFEEAVARAREPFKRYMRSHISLLVPLLKSLDIETEGVAEKDLDNVAAFAFERYARTASLIGTPESTRKLAQSFQDIGVNELACLIDWMDESDAFSGLEPLSRLKDSVAIRGPRREQLERHANSRLPGYMIPSIYVMLDALPLTPNGKINRHALPKPDLQMHDAEYVAPRGMVDQQLCAIWCEELKIGRIGIRDNFFQAGGTSLVAMRVLARIRGDFGIDVPVNVVFANPTVEAVTDYIAAFSENQRNAAATDNQIVEEGTF